MKRIYSTAVHGTPPPSPVRLMPAVGAVTRAALYRAAADLTPPREPDPKPWRCPLCGAPIVAGTTTAIWCWAGHATRIEAATRG